MADIINLNKARKQRAKDAASAKAVENRARFGRTKGAKDADRAERARLDRRTDSHRRMPDDPA